MPLMKGSYRALTPREKGRRAKKEGKGDLPSKAYMKMLGG